MNFSGLAFIFHFLPLFLIAYYIIPKRYRNIILLSGSIVFYSIGNPYYMILLAISVLINYLLADRIYVAQYKKEINESAKSYSKAWLFLALIYDMGMLFVFKYLGFVLDNIGLISGREMPVFKWGLPLGISFYTFQMISFVVDVYRKKYDRRIHLYHFATYAIMFPQIASGPITRYEDVRDRIETPVSVPAIMLEKGTVYFICGLGYKVLLADKITSLWNDVRTVGPLGIDVASAWLGAWGYSMQIYFDFFGYSLMAIGVAMMLGFKLPDNFDDPYTSKSMTEFWRRWHMTLGKWFKDYLYIPLGGNRCSFPRMILNIFLVWMFTGIWHGASWNFLIWGMFLFAIMFVEKMWLYKYLDKSKIIGHIYMVILIPVSWAIFSITDMTELSHFFLRLINVPIEGMVVSGMNKFLSLLSTYWWMLLVCIVFCTPYPMRLIKKFYKNVIVKLMLLVVFWYCVYQMANSGNNPFIYFNF